MRNDGRMEDEMRPVKFTRDFSKYAEGAVLVEAGDTRVVCSAMVEDRVPRHCLQKQTGWITSEYAMLPSANPDRKSLYGRAGGRATEIQRLIGRSLRQAVDLAQIGQRTIWLDCNVLQADGGTRTAAISGAFVALVDALATLKSEGKIEVIPVSHGISAVSVGIVENRCMLDLSAPEDRAASVDMNVVMTHSGEFVELQGTAEAAPFGRESLDKLLELAGKGASELKAEQMKLVKETLVL